MGRRPESRGKCTFCGESVVFSSMTKHLQSCVNPAPRLDSRGLKVITLRDSGTIPPRLDRRGFLWSGVNRKRVKRLMNLMGLHAICPGPNTSQRRQEHKVYPYLLRDLEITRPNQVWATDITYIRLLGGFLYLVAILDWYSRYVLAWRLSNSLDSSFCVEALEGALQFGRPDIFNSDQGVQFTSEEFTERLLDQGIRISMDSRGRALDNVFTERLWRSVKYEEVYLKDYRSVPETEEGIDRYFRFYNCERFHQALDYRRPWEVHFGQN